MKGSEANQRKIDEARQALDHLLAQTLRPGFFGSGSVRFVVENGTIQHVEDHIDRRHH